MTGCGRLLSAAVLFLAAVAPASAQRPQAGVGFLLGVPVGEFADNVDAAFGFGGHFDLGLGGGPVSLGGEAAILWYGTESRKIDLGPTIPELAGTQVTLTTNNAMVLVLGRVRGQPRAGRWRPYVDGLFGFNYIYTSTSLDDDDSDDSGIEATNLDDFVGSYGVGAGVQADIGRPGGIRLDFGLRYLRGGQADYLTKGAIRRENGQAVLDISRSRTDMVVALVGISFGR